MFFFRGRTGSTDPRLDPPVKSMNALMSYCSMNSLRSMSDVQTAETAIRLGSTLIAAQAAEPDSEDAPSVEPERRLTAPGVVRRLMAG